MASDTFTSTLGAILMGTGNDNNTWGSNLNSFAIQILEDAIANNLTTNVTGGTTDLSGNPPPLAPSQVRYASLTFTGALTANQIIYVPNLSKLWLINNQTSGAFYLSIQTKTPAPVIGSGSIITLGTLTGGSGYVNGTYFNVPLTGGSGSGAEATIVVAGGVVTTVTLTEFGTKYLSTDTGLTTANTNLGGSGSGFAINVATVGNLIPQNSGWQQVICDGSGNIIVTPFNSRQIQMPDGTAAAPSFSDVNETNSGWYRNGTQDWRLSIGGADVVQVTGTGAAQPSQFNLLGGLSSSVLPAGIEMPFAGPTPPNGFLFEFGQTVSRTTYPNLLAALRISFTCTFSNGSPTLSGVSTDLRGLGLVAAVLESATAGITNLTISSIAATTITMSGNATANSGGTVTVYAYPWGNGNGTSTFALPDRRGRTLAGRDDMGGTAAGRLTAAGSGIIGTELIASGGSETVTLTTGQMPSHNHGVTDPTHQHSLSATPLTNSGIAGQAGTTASLGTPTTITTSFASTGISINFTGGSTPHSNTQPTGITNYIIKF